MKVAFFDDCGQLVGGVGFAWVKVLSESAINEYGLLVDHGDVGPEVFEKEVFDVFPVDLYASL